MNGKGCRILILVTLAGHAVAQEIPRATPVAEAAAFSDGAAAVGSGSFEVTGGSVALRGAIALLAAQGRGEFQELTGISDRSGVPIEIRVHGEVGDASPLNPVLMRMIDVSGLRKFVIDLHVGGGVDQDDFQRAIFEVLVYSHALANEVVDAELRVPPWLAEGLVEASKWRKDLSDRRLYRALFERGGLFRIDEVLAMDHAGFRDLDGASRAAFRVSSGALVMALLEQSKGNDSFRAYLREVPAFAGEQGVLLGRHFPELGLSESSLRKWWTLQLAAKGGLNTLTEILSIDATDAELGRALFLETRSAEGLVLRKPINTWNELQSMEKSQRMTVVRSSEDALVHLSYRCFPSYRPIIKAYQNLLVRMVKGRTEGLETELAELESTRKIMLERARGGRDFLDWFEITRARQTSGEFDDFIELKKRLSEPLSGKGGSISSYLGQMDKMFMREGAGRQDSVWSR